MAIRASSYLFQAQSFVSDADQPRLVTALASARECERLGTPYPELVRKMVREAYELLEIDAPEVAAEFGPPSL